MSVSNVSRDLIEFHEFGRATIQLTTNVLLADGQSVAVPTFVNEFWTAKQRAANALHEISYRACFKPQLPRFFIQRLTEAGDIVYDPFMGRGTTPLEAALMGRVPYGCDINPLSAHLVTPRITLPTVAEVEERLKRILWKCSVPASEDLLTFFHPETLQQINALKMYLMQPGRDSLDAWIGMVALNRLTGHSPGFFSVYTLPPNQATSVKAQQKINLKRNQTPPVRDVHQIILKKSKSLLKECTSEVRNTLQPLASRAQFLTRPAAHTPEIPNDSVALVVTSPPFLDVVDYAGDNWLRCWFAGIDPKSVSLTVPGKLTEWEKEMTAVFRELKRVLKLGGHIAFEVGEVRGGKIKLEEAVVRAGLDAGLEPILILINDQEFTKTANCWGVNNNAKGTNTNRVVLFRKAAS